jgi:hypothetical protein
LKGLMMAMISFMIGCPVLLRIASSVSRATAGTGRVGESEFNNRARSAISSH